MGITLHVEVSEALPHQATLQPASETWDWSGFDQIKNDQGHFNPRRAAIYHYVIFAHDLGGGIRAGTSGISRNDSSSDAAFRRGASDLVVSLGGWPGTINQQAGTLMHELGHNLGLRHGGDDHQNYEPNYLSVMNYSFQTHGLVVNDSDGHLGYSRFASLPPLDERHLDETVGLNGGTALSGYGTRYYCRPLGVWLNLRVETANGPINWDCIPGAGGTDVEANINDGAWTEPDPTLGTLTGFDDWAALVFGGGPIGLDMSFDGSAIEGPALPVDELTYETERELYKPYYVLLEGGGSTIAALGATATTALTLTNAGALTATVLLSHDPGQGWFAVSSLPASVSLVPGAALTIPVTLTVPASRSAGIGDSLIVTATVQEDPLIGDRASLGARIGPLARFEAEPVNGTPPPHTVTFTDTSLGSIDAWAWNFGDGTTSSAAHPTHTYTAVGDYSVTLTVSGPDGSDALTRTHLVRVSPWRLYLPAIRR
jgi:hypothetical protein